MNFINPPEKSPKNVYHKTFYSQILNHKLGYNIYLPPEYNAFKNKYPVVYHIHGWNGNESSEIWSLEKVYQNKDVIFVFINAISTKEDYFEALFQIETVIINEIIPHIESTYKIDAA